MSPREKPKLQAIADVTAQLAALKPMNVPQLRARYEELFGVPTRITSRAFLQKKCAWRIQELAEGGLSDRAKARIEELATFAPLQFKVKKSRPEPPPTEEASNRDPRLPHPGTVLVRNHQGVDHHVTVLQEGFEYRGTRYTRLSKIAKEISGTNWNGFLFFHLGDRAASRERVSA